MSTTMEESASPKAEFSQLNDSNIEDDCSQQDDSNNINSQLNLNCTDPMDTTVVSFDDTLPPGVAPAGFVVLDEDNDAVNRSQQGVSSQESDIAGEGNCDSDVTKVPEEENVLQQQPVLKVVFKETTLLKKYCSRIETFLKILLHPEYKKKKLKSILSEAELNFYESESDRPNNKKSKSSRFSDDVDSDRSSSKKHKSSRSLDVTDSKDVSKENQSNDALFMVDTQPKFQDNLDIPMYGKKYHKAMQKNVVVDENENSAPKMTCFNCLGNHSLRDCDQPRNPMAINKNRREYNIKRGPTNARYHLEDDQKFDHFVPGQISPNLRKALGLKENELPRHIYRMRQLGYPPGWLEQARLQHSGLMLFGKDGRADGGSDEEGEIVLPGDKDKYDIKKIVEFPGFNVPLPRGVRDDQSQYWGSLVQEQNSIEAMLLHLSHKKADDGYKRRKLPNIANKRRNSDLNSGEMDVDEVEDTPAESLSVQNYFIPPLPKEDGPQLPPPPPPPPAEPEDSDSHTQEDISPKSPDENTNASPPPASPSLLELEYAKKQLLAELDESSSNSNSEFTKNGVPKVDSILTKVPEQPADTDSSQPNTPISDSVKNDTMESNLSKADDSITNQFNVNNLEVTPKNSPKPLHKAVTDTHVGTPILCSVSPFKRLPNAEMFSKDICDVINFENLPDATGKYDQMSGLLKKVRVRVAELQKE